MVRRSAQCSICLEGFQEKEVVKTLPCLHHFHASCIEEWLRREGQKVSCPVCKTPVFDGQALMSSLPPRFVGALDCNPRDIMLDDLG